jgi:hypothetical protein
VRRPCPFPVFVMNVKHRTDKRRHMEALLRDLGFSNVSFPSTTLADDLDVASLISAGAVSEHAIQNIVGRHSAGALRPYIAIAVDRVRAIARGATDGCPLFGVFEDDLLAGACPAETNRRIAAALRELPPDADALYNEACFESCGALRYSAHRPHLALADTPYCAAAMVFTARGARRIADLCTPVTGRFDSDDMMPDLVSRRKLTAYLALPGVLTRPASGAPTRAGRRTRACRSALRAATGRVGLWTLAAARSCCASCWHGRASRCKGRADVALARPFGERLSRGGVVRTRGLQETGHRP